MKNVLWITGLFPPISCGIGRQFKLAKYLPDYGWNPIVLAMEKTIFGYMDDSSAGDVGHLEVHRTKTWESNIIQNKLHYYLRISPRWFMSPDPYWGWRKYALREARRIVREGKGHNHFLGSCPIRAIFSTSTPYTCHTVALQLKRETGLPWVADFRDLWTQSNYEDWPRRILERERRMEREIMESADRITLISPAYVDEFGGQYPEHRHKMEAVTHGYDPADFPSRARTRIVGSRVSDNVSMTYVGTLYGERTKGAVAFLGALKEFYDGEPNARLEVSLVGHYRAVKAKVEELGLQRQVGLIPWQNRRMALRTMADADVLLLIMGEGKVDEQATTGKLFDYLGAGRPIFAVCPEGEASRIIEDTASGLAVAPSDRAGIKRALAETCRFHGADAFGLVRPIKEEVERYDVRRKAERMAEILEGISSS